MPEKNIVIDNGSSMIKAGFAGENQPLVKFPSIVGVPFKSLKEMIGAKCEKEYIGDDAQKLRGLLNISQPIEKGYVQSWENMEKILEYCFSNELRVDQTEHQVFMTFKDLSQKKEFREKMTQIMFETFQVNGFYVSRPGFPSLCSIGKTTGLACDSGDGFTSITPIFEGFEIYEAIQNSTFAGKTITNQLKNYLENEDLSNQIALKNDWQFIAEDIKKEICFISLDIHQDIIEAKETTIHTKYYELPDGQVIEINASRFMAPEIIFDPGLSDEYIEENLNKSLAELCDKAINKCDGDIQRDLYKNVILSGGNTLFKGFPDRLQKELDACCPQENLVKIIAPPDRYYSAWVGGSTWCSLSNFENQWITKIEYEEHGAEIVHRKCLN